MKLKDLDNLHEAVQIIDGVRKNMLMIESSSVKMIPEGLFTVFIIALEKAVYLMNSVADAVKDDII